MKDELLRAEAVSVEFATRRGVVHAVDSADLTVGRGETIALVGESGSGKSTLAKALTRGHRPARGAVTFGGQDIWGIRGRDLQQYRKNVQLMFQDPYSSLDPRMSIFDIIAEPLRAHRTHRGSALQDRIEELLTLVYLDPRDAYRLPNSFSGGQRQRVALARALALDPQVLVADEPVSALDVSVQAQIVQLLRDVQARNNLSLLLVSHDLELVSVIADRILVMYLGRIVEQGTTEQVLNNPQHPYTVALMSAIPSVAAAKDAKDRFVLSGEIPSPISRPVGCHFQGRCPIVTDRCREVLPDLTPVAPGHDVACLRPNEFTLDLV